MRRKRGRGRLRRLRAGLVTPSPGGLGSPSVPTTRDCLEWLDAARTKGGESCPDREPSRAPSAPGSYGPGDRNRRVERRVASVLRKGRHAARRRTDGCATRRSIPSAFCRGLEGNYGAPRAAQIIGARKRARLEQGRWRACALNAAASRPHRLRAVQAARSSPRASLRWPASQLRSDSKWSCWSRAARRR